MTLLATFKHISSKNADYGAAEAYLTFEHDEFTMKPTLDENGRLMLREDYRIATLNCGDEDFAVACMRSNLHVDYGNFKSVGVKMFPASLNLAMTTTATRKKQEAKISLELNQVKTDSKWSTQTEISSKYKQISPTDVLSKILSM